MQFAHEPHPRGGLGKATLWAIKVITGGGPFESSYWNARLGKILYRT